MSKTSQNLILLPTWRNKLEAESLQDLQDKKYAEALAKLNQLIDYGEKTHEILFGKLICLMELGRYDEAVFLCEDLINEQTSNHYLYVHVYLTILFQTGQYPLLMQQVETELESTLIPEGIRQQFQQLYDLGKQMNDDLLRRESSATYVKLAAAIEHEDYRRQWQLLESLRKMETTPTKKVMRYLASEIMHPVIKTVILKWLIEQDVSEEVAVAKFGVQVSVVPAETPKIRADLMTKQILLSISDLEQSNPSLYILLEQVLYRYLYVRYPIMPESSEVIFIGQALQQIGAYYFQVDPNEKIDETVSEYIKEIQNCEQLYLSIIEE